MQQLNLKVEGMTCMGCVNSVKRLLTALDGVEQVDVDLSQGRVQVGYDPDRVRPEALQLAIEGGGYRVVGEATAG
jgi:copper chaperone